LKEGPLKSANENRYLNVLYGISTTEYDEVDYGWQNGYDYNPYVVFQNSGYPSNMSGMNGMMGNTYYPQNTDIYGGNHFGQYVYNNNYQMPYVDPNQKKKGFDVFTGKAKN
jgi:hypothetical protein